MTINEFNLEHRIKSRIFDASRRAAELSHHQRSRSGGTDNRRGLHHSFEGRKSIRAELDSLKFSGRLRMPRERFNIEDARRILRENSIGSNTQQNYQLQNTSANLRSTSQNVISATHSEG